MSTNSEEIVQQIRNVSIVLRHIVKTFFCSDHPRSTGDRFRDYLVGAERKVLGLSLS